MDNLDPQQQAELTKMSTERLKLKLVKAGFGEQEVEGMKRPDAMTYLSLIHI